MSIRWQESNSRRLGTMNHLRLTVSDTPRAEAFYAPILEFMGYHLVEKSVARLAWSTASPYGLQWIILTAAHRDRVNGILVDRDLAVLDPPAEYDYEPGYYAVFFADPDGMKLELVHVPRRDDTG